MSQRAPIEVILYARDGCHLCEQAEATLSKLARRYPHTLRTVDIESDPALHARYMFTIPVVVVGEREYPAPLDEPMLAHALANAAA